MSKIPVHASFYAHAQPKSVLKAPEPVHVHHDVHDKDSHQTHKLLKASETHTGN